jgi:amino acid transporter
MAVAANCVLIAGLATLPFKVLVQADVVLMCFSYVLIFLTFVVLRIRFPRTSRPFRLPAYTRYLTWVYIVIPMVIVIVQIVTAPWIVLVVSGGTVALATAMYFAVFKGLHWVLKRRHKYHLIAK